MLWTSALLLFPVDAPSPSLAASALADDGLAIAAPAALEPLQASSKQKKKKGPPESSPMTTWSFAELHVQSRDVDELDEDMRGFGVRGGWEFDRGFFVRGGADLLSDDADVTRFDLGIGQTVPLKEDVAAFASLSWVLYQFEPAGGVEDFDENGYRIDAGVRGSVAPNIEAELRAGYEDVVENGLVWGGDLRYWFAPRIGIGLGFEKEVDDTVWTIGLRYAF